MFHRLGAIQHIRRYHRRAGLAIEIFCYRARKYIGAYAAAMGGLNCIVFTAGIGENDQRVRAQCVEGLAYLGAKVDPVRDKTRRPDYNDGIAAIHTDDSTVHVLVIATDEELMIARSVLRSCAATIAG